MIIIFILKFIIKNIYIIYFNIIHFFFSLDQTLKRDFYK